MYVPFHNLGTAGPAADAHRSVGSIGCVSRTIGAQLSHRSAPWVPSGRLSTVLQNSYMIAGRILRE